MLTFNLLHGLLLVDMVLPILIELRETTSHIVDEELWQLFVRFNDEAEEFAMVVIDDIAKLLLEREWLQVFPCEVFGLEDEDTILQLIDLLRLPRHKLLILLQHASQDHYIVRVEAKGEIICDPLRHLHI